MDQLQVKELPVDNGRKYLYLLTLYSRKAFGIKRKALTVGYVSDSERIHLEKDTFVDETKEGKVVTITQVYSIRCVGSMDKLEKIEKPIEGGVIRIENKN